jgi:hypothetical protein
MKQGLRELIGRLMIDSELLRRLQHTPDDVLAQYELSDEERTTVRNALARLAITPAHQRPHALHSALIRRVAT